MSHPPSLARRCLTGGLAFAAGVALALLMPRERERLGRESSAAKPADPRENPRGAKSKTTPGLMTVERDEADDIRFAIRHAEIDPLRAAEFAREHLVPGAALQEALEGIAVAWARNDPGAAATWTLLNERALNLILYPWFDQDPAAVSAWARTLGPVDARDRVWVQLVRWQMEKNPAGADAFIAEISDETLRARTAVSVVRRWARDDFDLAGEWALRTAAPALRSRLANELAQIATLQEAADSP